LPPQGLPNLISFDGNDDAGPSFNPSTPVASASQKHPNSGVSANSRATKSNPKHGHIYGCMRGDTEHGQYLLLLSDAAILKLARQ